MLFIEEYMTLYYHLKILGKKGRNGERLQKMDDRVTVFPPPPDTFVTSVQSDPRLCLAVEAPAFISITI